MANVHALFRTCGLERHPVQDVTKSYVLLNSYIKTLVNPRSGVLIFRERGMVQWYRSRRNEAGGTCSWPLTLALLRHRAPGRRLRQQRSHPTGQVVLGYVQIVVKRGDLNWQGWLRPSLDEASIWRWFWGSMSDQASRNKTKTFTASHRNKYAKGVFTYPW